MHIQLSVIVNIFKETLIINNYFESNVSFSIFTIRLNILSLAPGIFIK